MATDITTPRGEAVNLVRELREYGDNALGKITLHGLRCLFDAIDRMDAALITSSESDALRHDLERSIANHTADLSTDDKRSDTPRTDAAEAETAEHSDYWGAGLVKADFARQLERELSQSATRPSKDAARYEWLCEQLSERSLYIKRYDRAHELPRGGFALYNNSMLLGYGECIDNAIDAAMANSTDSEVKWKPETPSPYDLDASPSTEAKKG